jgi:predicted NUDIX family NTP pyrophosphohydrolase
MAKQSAGILLYKRDTGVVKVLLVHPGGPFWAKKDAGAWSAPKGEADDDEKLLPAAKREFAEEVGTPLPAGKPISLGASKISSGKVIHLWAMEHDFDVTTVKSNEFEMTWPPRSGQLQSFPEVDKAGWFSLDEAMVKLHAGQVIFVERLAKKLDVQLTDVAAVRLAVGARTGAKKVVTIKLEQTKLL